MRWTLLAVIAGVAALALFNSASEAASRETGRPMVGAERITASSTVL